ncbi:hypothetical protein O9993_02695 [Vibrio lentus]|nr:hypothetical protein [Vibrio lentus]
MSPVSLDPKIPDNRKTAVGINGIERRRCDYSCEEGRVASSKTQLTAAKLTLTLVYK